MIHARSRGVPRIINVICDAALVFGYAEERRQIDLTLIQDVVAELELTGVLKAASASSAAPVNGGGVPVAPTQVASAPVAVRGAEAPAVLSSELQNDALARVAQETAARAAALNSREQMLLQRERELAEQRRVLAEEYRLLRNRRTPGPATGGAGASARAPRRPDPVAPTRFPPSRPEGLRGWLRRLFSNTSHRAMEGTR